MEAINLDILPGAMPPIVHVSQGDVGRQFQIAIYDETGSAYSLTGKTLSIVGHKGDGNVFQYAIPSSAVSGNTVTITTEEQMTPAAGKALCEIRIEQNGTKIGTCNFVMQVEQGPADLGSLSTSALYIIDALMQEARDASAEAEAAAETAEAAISTVTQKAAEAAASATSAATSASNASSSASNAATSATAAAASAAEAASVVEGVHDDAVAAENAATAADLSATAAATSASTASTAASNASTYATAADSSADAASGYADAASQSATAAATSASNASGSASDASTAATNAANSATAASGSASDASTAATNASNSATAAAGSASDASTYAGNAASSATNAANSATDAASSASDAAAAESKIENMTVSSQSVPSTQSADVVKTEVGGVYNLDFKIPRGADGADGEGFKVKAQYATYADMIAAHPTGQAGDAYQVGENPAPSINNATITLTQGGVTKGSFTLNQASPATIDLDAGGSGGDSAMNIPFNPHAYIGEIYDSSNTKVFDRATDSSFTFVQGSTYNIRLFADAAKTIFDLKGKCIFLGAGQYTPYRYAAIPGTFEEDFSSMSSYLSDLGSMKYSYMLPDKVDVETTYSDLRDNLTKTASVKYVRESTDVNNVVYDKLKIIVNVYVYCTYGFTYTPMTSYDFDVNAVRSVPYYRSSNANIINV